MTNLKVTETYEKNLSADDIVKIAKQMWRYVLDSNEDSEVIYAKLWENYKDFCVAHSMVVRLMSYKQFDAIVLTKYLKYIKNKARDENSYFDGIAFYMCGLHKINNPTLSRKQLGQYKTDIINNLKQEYNKFQELTAQVQKEVEEESMNLEKTNVNELIDYIKTHDISGAEDIQLQHELSTLPEVSITQIDDNIGISANDLICVSSAYENADQTCHTHGEYNRIQ